jgi:hypothetical protein
MFRKLALLAVPALALAALVPQAAQASVSSHAAIAKPEVSCSTLRVDNGNGPYIRDNGHNVDTTTETNPGTSACLQPTQLANGFYHLVFINSGLCVTWNSSNGEAPSESCSVSPATEWTYPTNNTFDNVSAMNEHVPSGLTNDVASCTGVGPVLVEGGAVRCENKWEQIFVNP